MALTNEQLTEIRKRAEAATPGPWKVSEAGYVGQSGWISDIIIEAEKDIIAREIFEEADAEFIAHAREDVPKLLAEIERLQSVNKALRVLISADATPNDNVIMGIFGDKIKESAKKIADELRRKLGDSND